MHLIKEDCVCSKHNKACRNILCIIYVVFIFFKNNFLLKIIFWLVRKIWLPGVHCILVLCIVMLEIPSAYNSLEQLSLAILNLGIDLDINIFCFLFQLGKYCIYPGSILDPWFTRPRLHPRGSLVIALVHPS